MRYGGLGGLVQGGAGKAGQLDPGGRTGLTFLGAESEMGQVVIPGWTLESDQGSGCLRMAGWALGEGAGDQAEG